MKNEEWRMENGDWRMDYLMRAIQRIFFKPTFTQ